MYEEDVIRTVVSWILGGWYVIQRVISIQFIAAPVSYEESYK